MKTTNKRRILGLFLLIPMIIALLLGGCNSKNITPERTEVPIMTKVCKTPEGYIVYGYMSNTDYPIYLVVSNDGRPISLGVH